MLKSLSQFSAGFKEAHHKYIESVSALIGRYKNEVQEIGGGTSDTTQMMTANFLQEFQHMVDAMKSKVADFDRRVASTTDLYCNHYRNQTKALVNEAANLISEKQSLIDGTDDHYI